MNYANIIQDRSVFEAFEFELMFGELNDEDNSTIVFDTTSRNYESNRLMMNVKYKTG